MMGGDPNQFFDMLSGGKDAIKRDDLPPAIQRLFDRIAQSEGITNGQITRDQFKEAMKTMANRADGGFGGPMGPGGSGQGGGGFGGAGRAPAAMGGIARARILNADDPGARADQLATTLSLDNDQKEKLKKVLADHEKKVRDAAKKQQDALLKELKPVLSEDQIKKLQQLFNQTPPAQGRPPQSGPAENQPGPGGPPLSRDATIEMRAEAMFRRMDKNGDGLLSVGEMSETLAAEREKWDTNQDGFIDLEEFKAYFASRVTGLVPEANPNGSRPNRPRPVSPPSDQDDPVSPPDGADRPDNIY